MRMGVAFVLLSLAPVGAPAQTPRIDRIEVVEYGPKRPSGPRRRARPADTSGP